MATRARVDARVFRSGFSSIALLALAIGAHAHAQTWRDFSNPAASTLPVRYSLAELNDALRWNEIAIPPEMLARAHATYADAIDALLPACVPFAAAVAQGPQQSRGIRLSDAELARLRAHQRKLASAADAAEEKLFDELAEAVAAAALPDDVKARLEALRARRSLARFIEGIHRRSAIRGGRDLLADASSRVSVSGDLRRLAPSVRLAISAALDSQAADRKRAWESAETGIDASIAATMQAQRESQWREEGLRVAPVEPISAAVNARLIRTEAESLRAIAKAVPEVTLQMMLAEERLADGRWHAPYPSKAMPYRVKGEYIPMWMFSSLLVHDPQWDAETRKLIRPVLAEWLLEDAKIVSRWLDDTIHASEQAASADDPNSESYDRCFEARSALARDKLAQLKSVLKADWLVAGGLLPYGPVQSGPPTEEDARDFGGPAPAEQIADAAPTREGVAPMKGFWSTFGMIPSPWRDGERQDALEALQLDDAQLLIAKQLFEDAADEWRKDGEPVALELRELQQNLNALRHVSRGESAASTPAEFAGLPARRRACWATARSLDERLFANLERALGETPDSGVHYLKALQLVRVRESSLLGNSAVQSAAESAFTPDVVKAALELRASPQERAMVLAALSAQCADFLPAREAEWEAALKIQEESEALELRHIARLSPTDSNEVRATAHHDRNIQVRALMASADALVARMKRFDTELLGRLQAALPELLGHRLRRAIHVAGGTPELAYITNRRLNVLFGLKSIQPGAVAVAEAAFNAKLDAWEAWAEPIVDEIDRRFPGTDAASTLDSDSPTAIRAATLKWVLVHSAWDRVDEALCTIAAKVPPATARRIPQLARFAPKDPIDP